MSRAMNLVTAGLLVILPACYHATIETGLPPSPQLVEKSFASSWIYGLVPPSPVQAMSQCPNDVSKVETQLSFVNQLVGLLTLGIYTPMWIKVTCALTADLPVPRGLKGPPKGWPRERAWRPRRFLGSFRSGSDLAQIQVLVSGQSGTWFYNAYFASFVAPETPDKYRPYYPGMAALPANVLPVQGHVPGAAGVQPGSPTTENANRLVFTLETVRYSSRYGGSVELFFRAEDYEFEFWQPTSTSREFILWDVTDLRMSVFVNPRAEFFNPVTPGHPTVQSVNLLPVHVEFGAANTVAYQYKQPLAQPYVIQPFPADSAPDVTPVAQAVASGVTTGVALDASRFVYGYLHDQFQTEIAGTDRVDEIAITDNDIRFVTAQREAIVIADLQVRVSGFFGLPEAEGAFVLDQDIEWGVRINVTHAFNGADPEYFNHRVGIGDGSHLHEDETTRRISLGSFLLADCGSLSRIIFSGTIVEYDPVSDDQRTFRDRQLWFHDPTAHPNPDPNESASVRRVVQTYGCQDLRTRIGARPFGDLDQIYVSLVGGPDTWVSGELRLRSDLR